MKIYRLSSSTRKEIIFRTQISYANVTFEIPVVYISDLSNLFSLQPLTIVLHWFTLNYVMFLFMRSLN